MNEQLKTTEDIIDMFVADVDASARKIFKEKYSTLLHPSVLDPYRVEYADEQAEVARAIKAHMDRVTKRRNGN